MKYLIPLIGCILLGACDETSVSQSMSKDKGQNVTPPNLFLQETNMTLDIEKECTEESTRSASK